MRLFSPRLGKPLKQVCRNLSRPDVTEGGAIHSDRRAGVSRGHSRSHGRRSSFGTPEAERRSNSYAEPETRRLKARTVESGQ